MTDGYIVTDDIVSCCDCGKAFASSGRNFKFFTETYVPFRVAPLRMPVYLCEECEEKRLAEANQHTGISCEIIGSL